MTKTSVPATSNKMSLLAWLGVVGACVLFAVASTWELADKLATHLDRSTQDTLIHVWNSWWVKQALARGHNPYQCDMLYFPGGVGLATHNLAWFNIAVSLLLSDVIGSVAAYNASILLSLTLCGISAFCLGRRLTGNAWAALVGAAIYVAWPFRISHLGHPNMIATMFIPLFCGALLDVIEGRRWRDVLLAGLWFAMVGYTRWQLLIGAATIGAIIGLIAWLRVERKARWQSMLRVLLAGGVALVLLSPAIALLVSAQSDQSTDLTRPEDAQWTNTDILSYVVPWYRHPVYGETFDDLYDRIYASASKPMYPVYVGVVAGLLGLVGLARRWRQAWPWALTALALVLLALGPTLRIDGVIHEGWPMPYRLLEPLKLFTLMRFPRRFNMFLALPVAMLATLGLTALLTRSKAWFAALVALSLCGLVIFDYAGEPSLRDVAERTSTGLTSMAVECPGEAVINVPMGYHWAKQYMYEQTVHGHPILQGSISRTPDDAANLIESLPQARLVEANADHQPPPDDVPARMRLLSEHGVAFLALHPEEMPEEDVDAWRSALPEPFYEDERLLVYRTDLAP